MHIVGVGEFIFTSVLSEGTLEGYDLILAQFLAKCPYVTVLNGGCGKPSHMLKAFRLGASNVAASSMFLYTDTTPRDCAEYLVKRGIDVRNDPVEFKIGVR